MKSPLGRALALSAWSTLPPNRRLLATLHRLTEPT
jgi:hypothetical protein